LFLAPLFTFQELQDAKKKPKGKGIGTRDPSASSTKIDENLQHKTYSEAIDNQTHVVQGG
jgi:hypothetical protein